jgi:3-methyladenine DNA glycosylase AlkD
MTLDAVMAELEASGTEQTRKTYGRHGVPDPMFGVSFAKLGELKKRIKRDQSLADALWATGNADARFLAAMIADPDRQTPDTLEAWARGARFHTLSGHVAELAARTPFAQALTARWIDDADELVARTGWSVVSLLAMNDLALPDDTFEPLLDRIERDIHGARNREKEAMNSALIAIGIRDERHEALAIAAARRIGKVEVDHGDTACKTPDAEPYILKARARAKAKAVK